jgi:hypothetical protein
MDGRTSGVDLRTVPHLDARRGQDSSRSASRRPPPRPVRAGL